MAVITYKLNTRERMRKHYEDGHKTDFDLKFYLELAEYLIKQHAGVYTESMLTSEDAISFIAESMMAAATRYNGIGHIKAYLIQTGRYAILTWARKYRNLFKKRPTLSLDASYAGIQRSEQHKNAILDDLADKNSQEPVNLLVNEEIRELFHDIIEKTPLSPRQRQCINMTLDNVRPKDIAIKLGLTPQAVHIYIERAIRKFQKYMEAELDQSDD